MKETVTESRFIQAFATLRPNQFSRPALVALFDYLDQLEQDLGEETEFDPIALCTEWTEYADAFEAAEAYGWEAPDVPEGEERDDTSERKAWEWLADNTQVIGFEEGYLVLNF
jgi:hypothetical protein